MNQQSEIPEASILEKIQQTEHQNKQQLNLAKKEFNRRLLEKEKQAAEMIQAARISSVQKGKAQYQAHMQKTQQKANQILQQAEQEVRNFHQNKDSMLETALKHAMPILTGMNEKEFEDDPGNDSGPDPGVEG
ncbi:MAG: hypothetical protein JEZ06_14700 [Anaerolineaceae bacterium]|nr:hypothetical protein [Anaerolineaceae bacterium]